MKTPFYNAFKIARARAPYTSREGFTCPGAMAPHDGEGLAKYAKRKATALCAAGVAASEAAAAAREELGAAYLAHGHKTPEHKAALAKLNKAEAAARAASRALYGPAELGDNGPADFLRYVGRVLPDCGGRYGNPWDSSEDCGHYCNPWGESFKDGSGLCFGVVYQLTGRDGRARFVAGFEYGGVDGGPDLDLKTIYESEGEESARDGAKESGACRAADAMAKKAAEAESEYQAAWRAGSDYAEAGEEAATAREEARAILKERREAGRLMPALYPTLCNAIRGQIESLCETIRDARAKRAELAGGDCDSCYFWPGEERLRQAFCEGAGLANFPGRSD